jgi:hypothetical protein
VHSVGRDMQDHFVARLLSGRQRADRQTISRISTCSHPEETGRSGAVYSMPSCRVRAFAPGSFERRRPSSNSILRCARRFDLTAGKGMLTYSPSIVAASVKVFGGVGAPRCAMHLCAGQLQKRPDWRTRGDPGLSAGSGQMRPLSRGYVKARSKRHGDMPAINPGNPANTLSRTFHLHFLLTLVR